MPGVPARAGGDRRRLAHPPRRGPAERRSSCASHLQQSLPPAPSAAILDARACSTRRRHGLMSQHEPEPRRLRRRAQVPAADGARVPAAPAGSAPPTDARPCRSSLHTLDAHGARRHLRPAGRRLPSLQHRRRVARAALREDALRQRPARARLPAGATRRRASAYYRRVVGGDARLRPARDDRPERAASTPPRTPTPRARRASSTSGPRPRCEAAARRRGRAALRAPSTTSPCRGNFEHGASILHVRRHAAGGRRATRA